MTKLLLLNIQIFDVDQSEQGQTARWTNQNFKQLLVACWKRGKIKRARLDWFWREILRSITTKGSNRNRVVIIDSREYYSICNLVLLGTLSGSAVDFLTELTSFQHFRIGAKRTLTAWIEKLQELSSDQLNMHKANRFISFTVDNHKL